MAPRRLRLLEPRFVQPSTQTGPRRVLGVVLAGGRSRRLGIDKTRLEITRDGRRLSLVEWAARRLERCCDGVVLAGPAERAPPGLPVVADRLADRPADASAKGPAAGLLGAAQAAPNRSLLVLACDLPWVPAASLEQLVASDPAVDLALYRSAGGLEPLCALWRPRALEQLAVRCARGDLSLWSLTEAPELRCNVLDGEALGADAFFNLNRPDDLERFLERERNS